MRLNRFLASAGLGSRRSCEDLVLAGEVTVSGHLCTNLATEVSENDEVRVRGKVVHTKPLTYILLNKPTGFVCTRSDPNADRTIYSLVPIQFHDLAHVGRLDKDSAGLILLTNDGELTLAMTHPSHQMDKEYEVVLDKAFEEKLVAKLVRGFNIEGGWGKMESAFLIGPTKLKIILRQGINRQIRKMFYRLGYEVKRLTRTRIGPLKAERIKPGEGRMLTKEEIAQLMRVKAEGKKPSVKKSRRGSSAKPRGDQKPQRSGGRSQASPRRPSRPRRAS
ncbi:MAG: pseudouridine synthase [Chthoniobacterales bacterium]